MNEPVYKYVSASNWKNFFENWTIRFTPPEELNDPYDCRPVVYDDGTALSKERCLELKNSQEFIDGALYQYNQSPHLNLTQEKFIDFIALNFTVLFKKLDSSPCLKEKFTDEMIRYFRSHYGVLSLTTQPNNILMWTHYADNHKGFVVGIDRKSYSFEGILNNVQYCDERPKVSFQDIINDKYNNFIKSTKWSYEEEVRAIAPFSIPTQVEWVDEKNEEKTENKNKVKGLAVLQKEDVLSITFGADISEDEIQNKCEQIRHQAGCEHILLNRVVLHPDKYELVIKPCEISS